MVLACIPAFGQRPLGTDVSHYQGAGINWPAVKAAGVSFAWAKATEGTGFTDANFAGNEVNAKAAGVLIGAYHFARPSQNPNITGANSADSEAAHYWSVAGNYVKAGSGYCVPMLDWEDTGATIAAGFTSSATMSAWVIQWCNSVSNYARAAGIPGLKPVIYTGVWYSQPGGTYPGLTTAVTNWPSWIAAYPANPQPQTGGPSSSFPWPTWNLWQYADTNWSGGDSDVFKGTLAGFTNMFVVGAQGGPIFVTQPSNRNADRGGSITMAAPAGGLAPLRYQWRFNGVNIANATNSALTLSNIQTTNAGNYTAVVTNSAGSITSNPALLTVNPLFTTVFSDEFDVNSSANWTLNRSSTDSRVSFAYNYAPYGIPSAPKSVGGTTKGVKFEANVSLAAAGALNISPIGQNFGGNYRLHYDMWINANGPFPAGGAGSTQHQTAGLGTAGNRVQWNSGTSDGVWFAIDGEGQATDTSPDIRAFVGTALQNTNTGVYVGGTDTEIRRNSHAYYANVFPGGQSAPGAQSQSGQLETGTVGFAWRDVVVNKTGNVIEWFIDGLKIAAVTNALTASNIFIGYWDTFNSLSDNTNLSFGIVDNLRVEVPVVAPSITTPPQPLTVVQGSNATFTVVGTGVPAPAYQWRFAGTNIAGANGSSYTRSNAQTADAGSYSVVLTNVGGAVTSAPVTLTVNVPPSISTPPSDVTTNTGGVATFSVTATGVPSPSYQWLRQSAFIGGANSSTYTIGNVQTNDAGQFQVIVANVAGAVTSAVATLTVTLPPGQPSQFQLIELLPDQRVHLILSVESGTPYLLQTSSNLTDWTTLTNFVNSNSVFEFTDEPAANIPSRFYRARIGP